MNLTVNIGLNVGNIQPAEQIFKTKKVVSDFFDISFINEAKFSTGEYNGVKEKTLVFKADVGNLKKEAVAEILAIIAYQLDQDCIAFKLNGVGCIAFNGAYCGEIFPFNEEYFIEF